MTELGLLQLKLTTDLGVTKFVAVIATILVTLLCYFIKVSMIHPPLRLSCIMLGSSKTIL